MVPTKRPIIGCEVYCRVWQLDLQNRLNSTAKRPTKETYKRDLQKRPTQETYKETNTTKETYKRDLQKRLTKETNGYERDLIVGTARRYIGAAKGSIKKIVCGFTCGIQCQKRPTKETYKKDQHM